MVKSLDHPKFDSENMFVLAPKTIEYIETTDSPYLEQMIMITTMMVINLTTQCRQVSKSELMKHFHRHKLDICSRKMDEWLGFLIEDGLIAKVI